MEASVAAQQRQEVHLSRQRVDTWGEFKASVEAQGVTDATELRSMDVQFPARVEVLHEDINAPFGIDIKERA
jgi:hypothetical protein